MEISIKWVLILIIFIVAFFISKDDFNSSGILSGIYGIFVVLISIILSLVVLIIFK